MNKLGMRWLGALFLLGFLQVSMASEPGRTVDFCWGIDWWQTALFFPNDAHKSLVGKEGQLLHHFPGKYEYRGLGFGTVIQFCADADLMWQSQELYSPKVPLVITRKSCEGIVVTEEAFSSVHKAEGVDDDIVIVTLKNEGEETEILPFEILVRSERSVSFNFSRQRVVIGADSGLSCSLPILEMTGGKGKFHLDLGSLEVRPGQELSFAVRFRNGWPNASPISVVEARVLKRKSVLFWEAVGLSYNAMVVPDMEIQHQLTSALRNIYQGRDIIEEHPVYQAGPTVGRGLSIIDAAFLLETATLIGEVEDARHGIDYLLSFQKKSGGFSEIDRNWKETGVVLWACSRHARLTQDKAWLESIWPRFEWAVSSIQKLRKKTMSDPEAPNFGLLPAGFPGGGLGKCDRDEYTNVYWSLIGLKSAIESAHWLGEEELAMEWQDEYDSFFAAYRRAAMRDLTDDGQGNQYVPTLVSNVDNELPQRAQWAFCHAVYLGNLFASDDLLMVGTLKMLKATKREGLVYGAGWKADGLWNSFASFYGHAALWNGDRNEAIDSLYAFANHASPTLCWREEQNLSGDFYDRIGDMPQNRANAEFVRLTKSLLAIERGNELHLFEGLPIEWAQPGMITQLKGVLTRFGPLDLELVVSENGKKAKLTVGGMPAPELGKLVVHLGGWASTDPNAVLEFSGKGKIKKSIKIFGENRAPARRSRRAKP